MGLHDLLQGCGFRSGVGTSYLYLARPLSHLSQTLAVMINLGLINMRFVDSQAMQTLKLMLQVQGILASNVKCEGGGIKRCV
jgi:hypothetical protein